MIVSIVGGDKICGELEVTKGELYSRICGVLDKEPHSTFYLGGDGEYFEICYDFRAEMKKFFPRIKLCLVSVQSLQSFDCEWDRAKKH